MIKGRRLLEKTYGFLEHDVVQERSLSIPMNQHGQGTSVMIVNRFLVVPGSRNVTERLVFTLAWLKNEFVLVIIIICMLEMVPLFVITGNVFSVTP